MPTAIRENAEVLNDALGEQALARAFATFTEAAGSLERSYGQLQREVARLRQELDASNCELNRSLEENHRMRQYLDAMVAALPCGVLAIENDGEVRLANPETRRLLGVSASEPLPQWITGLLRTVSSAPGELEYRPDGGPTGYIAIHPACFEGQHGHGTIYILEDVSEEKRLQREREVLRRRQALAQMSALLAHEIRNPLGALELFAGLLAGSALPEECREWVEHLRSGLRTLSATVNNVLQFHSEAPPERANIDLGELLRSVHDFLRPLAQQARVRLELAGQLEGLRVAADRHRVEQVLLNLALNAVKVMPGGGLLRLAGKKIQQGAPRIRIEVTDSGPGIAPENLERIFEPGFTTRAGSPGLGLAVCRTIMQQHAGSISVASRPGRGASFILDFPWMGASA